MCSCLNFAENVFFSRKTESICAATKSAGLRAVVGDVEVGTGDVATADVARSGGAAFAEFADEGCFAGSFFVVDSVLAAADADGSGIADDEGTTDATDAIGAISAEAASTGDVDVDVDGRVTAAGGLG